MVIPYPNNWDSDFKIGIMYCQIWDYILLSDTVSYQTEKKGILYYQIEKKVFLGHDTTKKSTLGYGTTINWDMILPQITRTITLTLTLTPNPNLNPNCVN